MLNIIALPKGARGKITFDKRLIHDAVFQDGIIELINSSKGKNKDYYGIFWGLNCGQTENDSKKFLFACPIRVLRLNSSNFNEQTNQIDFEFIADDFFSQFCKYGVDELNEILRTGTGNQHPLPCYDKGHVQITPQIIDINNKNDFSEKPFLYPLYEVLSEIPCMSSRKDAVPISNYPLIFIENIEKDLDKSLIYRLKMKFNNLSKSSKGAEIDDSGNYKIKYKQDYKIIFDMYQGDKYRNREIVLNLNNESKKLEGKTSSGDMSLIETNKKREEINLKVSCIDLDYFIEIPETVYTPSYNLTTPDWVVIIASIFAIIVVVYLSSDVEKMIAGIISLLVIILKTYLDAQKN